MELNFSRKGLLSFDASVLGRPREGERGESAPVILSVDLSHNALRVFRGGETLKTLTVLNLAHNELTSLAVQSLPPLLMKLVISYNHLVHLNGLSQYLPRLEVLEAGHNQLTSSGLRELPASLTTLGVANNELLSLEPLVPLTRLAKLNVAANCIAALSDLHVLEQLRSLRQLDLRGNPIVVDVTDLTAQVTSLAPRLSSLNGAPLSQATGNSMYKANHAMGGRGGNTSTIAAGPRSLSQHRSASGQRPPPVPSRHSDSVNSSRGTASRSRPREVPLETRLLEAKVRELRRLLQESQQAEHEGRQRRGLLMQQVKRCAQVIDSQAAELEQLQSEIESLRQKEAALKEPMQELEQTFEQTHASLLARKVGMSQMTDAPTQTQTSI